MKYYLHKAVVPTLLPLDPSVPWNLDKYDPDQPVTPWSDDGPWNITGGWHLYSPPLAKMFGLPELSDDMTINFCLTMDTKDNKKGKQLWATFKLGSFEGIIRFCPSSLDDPESLPEFEKQCFLSEDASIGQKREYHDRLTMRWRGTDLRTGIKEGLSDKDSCGISFRRPVFGGDIHLQGTFIRHGQRVRVEAYKDFDSSGGSAESSATSDSTKLYELWALHDEPSALWRKPGKPQVQSDKALSQYLNSSAFKFGPRPAPIASSLSDVPPRLTWDICGRWEIKSRGDGNTLHEIYDVPDKGKGPMYLTISSIFDPIQETRQLWGEMELGKLHGIIRFCPSPSDDRDKDNDGPKGLSEFEKACVFGKDCYPGPPPSGKQSWLVRWRGYNSKTRQKEAADDFMGGCTIGMGENGQLHFSTVHVYKLGEGICSGIGLTGRKVDGPIPPDALALAEKWKSYKPEPAPGPSPDDGPWDVTGQWRITSPDLVGLFKIPEDSMSMQIHVTRDVKARKNGRQMWATFKFGHIEGVMRFCPPIQGRSQEHRTLQYFEKSCFLNDKVQVGRRMSGTETWRVRSREADLKTGKKESGSDMWNSSCTFQREDDGNITLSGSWIRGMFYSFRGSRISSQAPTPVTNSTKVHILWQRYASDVIDLVDSTDEELIVPIPKSRKPKATKTTRPAGPVSSMMGSSSSSKAPETSWDVEGQYTLISTSHPKLDTTKFSLRMYYYRHCSPRQLYGEFDFGDLKGILRLCPLGSKEQYTNAEFSKLCDLDTETRPGLKNTTWIMNWRGVDGGMRQSKKVGGDATEWKKPEFYFEQRPFSSILDFTAIDIEFCMIYEGNEFMFTATKRTNLEGILAKPPWVVSRQWDELGHNPSVRYNYELHNSFNRLTTLQEENMISQPGKYTAFGVTLAPSQPSKSIYIHDPPTEWWDMTGEWHIRAKELAERLGLPATTEMIWTIKMDNLKTKHHARQFWARFSFGDAMEGIVRFCPTPWSPIGFDQGPDVWPSRKHKNMRVEWRGVAESQPGRVFGTDERGSHVYLENSKKDGMRMYGSIVYKSHSLFISGKKIRDVTRPETDGSVESYWEGYQKK